MREGPAYCGRFYTQALGCTGKLAKHEPASKQAGEQASKESEPASSISPWFLPGCPLIVDCDLEV